MIKREAPGGEVIRQLLPKDKPSLILMDELMNYVSRNRKSGLGGQLYNFLQNLSEVARSRDNVVLAVSIPASELEMTAEDQSDFERFKKVLDRLGKAIVMSSDAEISEIIRRRLFEWDERAATRAKEDASREYADWVVEHRQQIPKPVQRGRRARGVHGHLSISPGGHFRVRAQVAGVAPVSANPRRVAPARAVGVAGVSGRIQRRTQGCPHRPRHRPARRCACSAPPRLSSWAKPSWKAR